MNNIEVNPTLGTWCTQQRLDFNVNLAKRLQEECNITGVIKVWYDAYDDFCRIHFELDGHTYTIQTYKVFGISRDWPLPEEGKKREIGMSDAICSYEYSVIEFFQRKKHLTHKWSH